MYEELGAGELGVRGWWQGKITQLWMKDKWYAYLIEQIADVIK